jgi:hypothetical protein
MRQWWNNLTPEQRREKTARRDPARVREQDRKKQARRRERGTAEQKLKIAARNEVRKALLRGDLVRQPCERCGKPGHAHHDDYQRPLDVRWLCRKHHLEEHAQAPEPSNAS